MPNNPNEIFNLLNERYNYSAEIEGDTKSAVSSMALITSQNFQRHLDKLFGNSWAA